MQVILSMEADAVDVLSAARETPLFWAVQGGHELCVRTLLHWGAKRDVKNARGQTPTDVATDALKAIMKDADSGEPLLVYPALKEHLYVLHTIDQRNGIPALKKHPSAIPLLHLSRTADVLLAVQSESLL